MVTVSHKYVSDLTHTHPDSSDNPLFWKKDAQMKYYQLTVVPIRPSQLRDFRLLLYQESKIPEEGDCCIKL